MHSGKHKTACIERMLSRTCCHSVARATTDPAAAADGWREVLAVDLLECNSLNLASKPKRAAKFKTRKDKGKWPLSSEDETLESEQRGRDFNSKTSSQWLWSAHENRGVFEHVQNTLSSQLKICNWPDVQIVSVAPWADFHLYREKTFPRVANGIGI